MSKSGFTIDVDEQRDSTNNSLPIDKAKVREFASGAHYQRQSPDELNNWQNKNPQALPTHNFRLRLNDYQIGLLKTIAKQKNRSALLHHFDVKKLI